MNLIDGLKIDPLTFNLITTSSYIQLLHKDQQNTYSLSKDMFINWYKEISENIHKVGGSLLKEISLFDLYVDKKIDDEKHSLSISLCFSSPERTLQDKDVDTLMDKIIKELKNKFDIIQR